VNRLCNSDQSPMIDVTPFLEDAAHFPGGHAAGVIFPRDTREVADAVTSSKAILPIGAQSSLTGGATPMGETILSTSKMTRILELTPSRVRVQAGVTVQALQDHLAAAGAWFPPAPTFTGACAGGIVATNAAGAATFKYGSTRDWVEELTVVLADGTVLELRRGEHVASGTTLEVPTRGGRIVVPIPSYAMPDVPKRSAGYHAAAGMDLVNLFIGSEGTLGVITEVTFRILSPAPASALALVPCSSEAQGLAVVDAIRRASRETWHTGDRNGIDVAAIEHMDRRSIDIVREDRADARHNVSVPPDTEIVLLVQLELARDTTQAQVFDQISRAFDDGPIDTALVRFCRLLADAGVFEQTELALPGDRRRMDDFIAIREAVPAGVNQRVGQAKRDVDPRIEKTAADMIVPADRFAEMMQVYRDGFTRRGLDYAIWGHISDGNVHPNVIPRSYDDVVKGKDAILEFGREVARLGGSPLAEHGVGRNPVKQALLRQLYGDAGIDQMRAVKRALDPGWKLSPGVIFLR
jgi:D-lactate dehydrogenase (cytochrome)